MSDPARPLIVGAGPVGLAAGLFLTRTGHRPRIIETLESPSTWSKALAVNPRTLDILGPSGVTDRMLERGGRMLGACMYRNDRELAKIDFEGIHPRYPFMLALSQATTESLLSEALHEAGGTVERGVKLVTCRNVEGGIEASLEGESSENVRSPWLLAADGAHSVVRHQMGISFEGSSLANEWHLADVPLKTSLADDRAHVFFLDEGGFLFLIRVVDDARKTTPGGPIWRVIGSAPEPLSRLRKAEVNGPPIWESSFRIAHRINETFAKGSVYFAGDAAHIHSPIGARGMNLGVEDAWVFAELVNAQMMDAYDRLRRPVDARVVSRIERFTRFVSTDSRLVQLLRSILFPIVTKIGFLRTPIVKTGAGLDHELPKIPAQSSNAAMR